MPSLTEQYYFLSHRLRGILTTFESINKYMLLPNAKDEDVQRLLAATFQKGYNQIEEFRKILERRAITRDKASKIILRMLSTLYIQVEENQIPAELFKTVLMEELNMTAREVQLMIEYNHDMEREL